jgi:hypothetical protein
MTRGGRGEVGADAIRGFMRASAAHLPQQLRSSFDGGR